MCDEKQCISWLERQQKEKGIDEPAQIVSSIPRLFADEILAFIFCFKREESMAMPAEHEVLLPRQISLFFFPKNSLFGSSGDVITVQSTCKTHSPRERVSLIDHSWLLSLTARITKWLICILPFVKCILILSQSRQKGINSQYALTQTIVRPFGDSY